MRSWWVVAAVSLAVFLSLGCISQGAIENPASGRLRVIATIFPLYDMARSIGGEHADVTLFIPPGTETHSFEPTPEKEIQVSKADIFIMNGLGIEPWADKVVSASDNPGLEVQDASLGIEVLKFQGEVGGSGQFADDPHVFQDPALAVKQADNVAAAFVRKDPTNGGYYRGRAEEYKKRLMIIDDEYRKTLAGCKSRTVLVNHAFLGYVAREYGFAQISLTGLNPEAEPRPQDLAAAVFAARENGVKYILYESTVSPKNAEAVAREGGLTAVGGSTAHEISLDDFNSGKTYPQLLEENLDTLRKVMECG